MFQVHVFMQQKLIYPAADFRFRKILTVILLVQSIFRSKRVRLAGPGGYKDVKGTSVISTEFLTLTVNEQMIRIEVFTEIMSIMKWKELNAQNFPVLISKQITSQAPGMELMSPWDFQNSVLVSNYAWACVCCRHRFCISWRAAVRRVQKCGCAAAEWARDVLLLGEVGCGPMYATCTGL